MLRSSISHIFIVILSLAGLRLAFEIIGIVSGIEARRSLHRMARVVVRGVVLTRLRVVVVGHRGSHD